MRRRDCTHCAAWVRHQHMGLLRSQKRKRVITCTPYLPLAPWHREHSRRAAGKQPRTGLGEGLVIATWARPPRLTCEATGVIIVSCPRSWRNSRPRPLSGQMESLGAVRCDDAAWEGIFFCPPHSASRRISPCRSLGQECTCRAGYEVVKVRPLCRPSKIGQDALQCFPHSWCSSLDRFPHRLRLFGGQVAVRQVVTIWQ